MAAGKSDSFAGMECGYLQGEIAGDLTNRGVDLTAHSPLQRQAGQTGLAVPCTGWHPRFRSRPLQRSGSVRVGGRRVRYTAGSKDPSEPGLETVQIEVHDWCREESKELADN